MNCFSHLSLSDRIRIESSLNSRRSFKKIAEVLGKHPSSISLEIRKHLQRKRTGGAGQCFNDCAKRMGCKCSGLCNVKGDCFKRYCHFCLKCSSVCPEYEHMSCPKLSRAPYVCNGCVQVRFCSLEKSFYEAEYAHKVSREVLSESRGGVSVDEEEIVRLDGIVSPLIKQGQSIYHICSNNRDVIMRSERSIYNYVEKKLLSAVNLDMPRKVRYRPRRGVKEHFKVDKSCRKGRMFSDFTEYLKYNPDVSPVQIDTVEGIKGGPVLLTVHFLDTSFMLAFLRGANTARSVSDVFDGLYSLLGIESFKLLFPVILTDNGSEFSAPMALEKDAGGIRRCRVFYCDPSSPFQKGAIENNHELIRRIIPKGKSFGGLSQPQIQLMMDHINSYNRKKLNGKSPHDLFSFLHGPETLQKLGATKIAPNEIRLSPSLLK